MSLPIAGAAKLALKRGMSRLYGVCGGRAPQDAMRCLVYHSIVPDFQDDPAQMTTPIALFQEQMAFLAESGYRVADAAEITGQLRKGEPISPKTVVITFDDGYVDNLELALPVLQAHRFPATVFLISATLDGLCERVQNGWGGKYLNRDQVREMVSTSLIQVGCHSATHRRLRGLPTDLLREETAGAKCRLEERLGCAVDLFAYPFGAYDSWDLSVRAAVEQAGFTGAFTTIFGVNPAGTDCLLLRRSRISWCEEIPEFERVLRGGYDWYALAQWCQNRPAFPSSTGGSSDLRGSI